MSRIVDDDPPIKTHAATQAYRDNWDRTFGEPEPVRVVEVTHFCATCEALVVGHEEHLAQGHALLDTRTNEVQCTRPTGCGVCGELEGCVCDDHDPACERLCTEGADCNCGARC